ncbi:ankyrin repeat, SAM and basic leucine zipper domain-containing protein 1 isoform X4 [Oxyura jamaicensis]|uniref:ankyrin repeat, SAM and basic leucine zipper domain-containing protein 1 isoform X4 n=1 Tax=Oxyura jamaicensis TaxID=8884 RepID=UPI0015A6EE4E|nr:ankyrin repeat, SAM and basic leucine zipper domain-containing protein 1 isoform X4 [Oxyura jamaicensis]
MSRGSAASWGARVAAGCDEDFDSDDDDCWDIGVPGDESQLEEMVELDKKDAFKKALVHGDVPLIEELLNSGISIESSFQFGWTPLMCAASVADFAVVRLLLDRGANACFEIDKYTVLMAACAAHASEENILKTVELLLSRNVDPNLTCRRQMTPLMYAARKGHSRVVGFLVAHGSDINAQDENGYSALIWAAHHGHKNVIFKLLELGADKNLQTKDEKTAAELAKINKHSEIYSLLSLAVNHSQGKYHETIKQEAIYRFLTAVPDHRVGSYSTFDDMEVFLHGLGLEHLIGLLKERDVYLRQLLIMQKEELIQIVLQWAPTERYIEVCRDMVHNIERLGEEVTKLKDLVEKHEQKNDPSRVLFPEKPPTLEKRLVKMGALTLFGFGLFFFTTKLMAKKG